MKNERSNRIGISSGGERCNMVVMKCLLDRKEWKPKIFYKEDDFWKRQSLRWQEGRK